MMEVFDNLNNEPLTKSLIDHFGEDGLYEQLSYHQKLLRVACEFGSSEILEDYLSLRYRLFITRHIDLNYFLMEAHYWCDAIRHYLFEPYAAEFITLYNEIIAHHQALCKLDVTYTLNDSVIGQLTQSLINADEAKVREIFHSHIDEYDSPLDFLDQLIKPAMVLIGIAWERAEISVAKEHVATAIIERVWGNVSNVLIQKQSSQHSALIITPDSQLHKLGSKMVGTFIESKGWKVAHISLHEHDHEIFRAIDIYHPDLIICSVMLPICIPLVQSFITTLRTQEPIYEGKIIVGGQAFYRTNPPIILKDVDFQSSSLKELEAYIESLSLNK